MARFGQIRPGIIHNNIKITSIFLYMAKTITIGFYDRINFHL